ncbi:MAG: DUF2914 domain-containing protein [Pseudomonadota bacterium]
MWLMRCSQAGSERQADPLHPELSEAKVNWMKNYLPMAIQFFLGGLSSAFVIYFSRSVSLTKTAAFFIILISLLVANEFLKKRIANRYLQFSLYSFISFTFFSVMIPVIIKAINIWVFILSGAVSLTLTLLLISLILRNSKKLRSEISKTKMIGLVVLIYALMNAFYFSGLIPPVPLALDSGMVAHDISIEEGKYLVKYEKPHWYQFWRNYSSTYNRLHNEKVYCFSSIFAPTMLQKAIIHRWQWYDGKRSEWVVMQDINFKITGGRDQGFRGYTYKSNVRDGLWKVEVITVEEAVLGVINFEIKTVEDTSIRRTTIASF